MSWMPNQGSIVRLRDGRLAIVTKVTPKGDDDRLKPFDGLEQRIPKRSDMIEEIIEEPGMNGFWDFYGGPLSNFNGEPFTLPSPWDSDELVTYARVEVYFQAMKATTKEEHDYVAICTDPGIAKQRGQRIKLRDDWEDVKYDVMMVGLREKFKDPSYRKILLETGTKLIREDSPTDTQWGYRKGGRNLLGVALMQVRYEIRAALAAYEQ